MENEMKCNFFLQKHEREARLKEIMMPLLRGEFEEFEQLHIPAIELSKSDMINDIKQSDSSFSIPSTIAKNEDLSIHYVSMRYILKNSSDSDVQSFKAYVHSKGLGDDFIARVAGIFYKKSSSAIHNVLIPLSLNDIEIGLRANGIENYNYMLVVKSLYAFRRNRASELN